MEEDLPFELYDFWLISIRKNDHQTVQKTLGVLDEASKKKHLNGKFVFSENDSTPRKDKGPVNFTRAWSIAVSCGSTDVIKIFVNHGVDIFTLDKNENNILHVLTYTALNAPDFEEKIRDTYALLQTLLPSDAILHMLRTTNDQKMRPTELAAHFNALGLFLDMFETPGLHMVEECRNGINLTQWFDITEYESRDEGNRRAFCPIWYILLLDKASLGRQGTKELFKHDIMMKWVDADYKASVLFIFAWFFLRFGFSFMIFLFDGNALLVEEGYRLASSNGSLNETCLYQTSKIYQMNEGSFWVVAVLILMYCTAGILIDCYEYSQFLVGTHYTDTPKGSKDTLMHFHFYRVIQFCLNVDALAMVVVKTGRIYADWDIPFVVDNLLYTGLGLFNFWSYMFFAQVCKLLWRCGRRCIFCVSR